MHYPKEGFRGHLTYVNGKEVIMKDGASEEQTDLDREFISTTTLHGISRVIDSSRTLVKLLWLTILLVCLGVCVWQITDRFQRYFKYEATTAVSVEYQGDLPFPAVTICNFNRYRSSAMTKADWAKLKVLLEYSDYDYDFYDDEGVPTETPLPDDFSYTEVTLRTGFQMDEETLVDCEWRGKKKSCDAHNFTHVFTSFGNCWTFNFGKNRDRDGVEILNQIQPGSGNGLKMIIDIQQSEYTEIAAGGNVEAGLKILVHDQETPPSVDAEGLAIGPGVHAFVGVREVQYNNLEKPWGKCDTQMALTYYKNYTLPGCAIECRAKKIAKACKHPGNEKECSPQEVKNCTTPVLTQLKTGEIKGCDCPLPCNYSEFRTRLSTATLPNNNVVADLWSAYRRDEFYNYTEEQSGKYIRENWILLDVYYESLNLEKYVQSEAISPSALISDIGGQLGLFLGASFITMAEILDYLGRKSFRFITSCSQRQAVEPTKTRPKEEAMGIQDLPSCYQ